MAKTVFYSFHHEHDVQLVRNIIALEGRALLNSQKWEEVRCGGDPTVERWINEQIAHTKAVPCSSEARRPRDRG